MTSKRSSHSSKTRKDRQTYFRYIGKLDYEPTVGEAVPFQPSNEGGEELIEPTTDKKRPIRISQRIKDHFDDNWLSYLITVGIAVMFFLMVDSKIDIAKINVSMDSIKENIKYLIFDTKKSNENYHQQNLTLKEYDIRLNNLEKQLEPKRK